MTVENPNGMKSVGLKIRQRRKEKKLSQEALAELLGMGQNTLSAIERGGYSNMEAHLGRIEEALEFGSGQLKDML
jgi:transcriptional regulator with XRE-family HTH domain